MMSALAILKGRGKVTFRDGVPVKKGGGRMF